MWSFQRYRTWLDSRTKWTTPDQAPEPPDAEPVESSSSSPELLNATPLVKPPRPEKPIPSTASLPPIGKPDIIEIEPDESEFGKILKRPGEQ
jgi:hypothetical protein